MTILDILPSISPSKLIQLLGGTAVISSAISVLVFEWLKSRWKKRDDKQLETLKGEIQKNNSTLTNLSSAYLSNFNEVQKKRIEAAEHLWSAVLQIRDSIPAVVYMAHTILLDAEMSYQKVASVASIKNEISVIDEMDQVSKLNEVRMEMRKYKPFLMDRADNLFAVYQILVGRASYNFVKGFKQSSISSWKADDHTKRLIKEVLSEKEVAAIYDRPVASFEIAMVVLETKIMMEIRENLYGKTLTLDTLEHLKFLDTSWHQGD